jgi:hypothetical protein
MQVRDNYDRLVFENKSGIKRPVHIAMTSPGDSDTLQVFFYFKMGPINTGCHGPRTVSQQNLMLIALSLLE